METGSSGAAVAQLCAKCGTAFQLRFAYQRFVHNGSTYSVCSTACRTRVLQESEGPVRRRYGLAVLNQKGGTGKTTTSVSLAAGLARAGKKVLLIDCDSQGHVGVSLGVSSARSVYHLLVENAPVKDCAVSVEPNLDVIVSNETLASAEVFLARQEGSRDRLLRQRLQNAVGYDYILVDCAPSLSLMTMNALTLAEGILVPVSCDYLSLVGVKQILKTVRQVNEILAHPVKITGVLPTLYDPRNRISDESIATLRTHFGDRVLPPIRVNTRLKEAPSHGQSIFEYAPDSRGAEDYGRLVQWLIESVEGAQDKTDGTQTVTP